MARLAQAQQEKCRRDHHRDRHEKRRRIHRRSDRQGSEAHMGQSVSDHGVALEDQGDPQHGRTKGDQRAHQKGPHHKRIGKHFYN